MRFAPSKPSACDPINLRGQRLLIFVVAYNAATTIEKVLSRIPPSLRTQEVEVLIIDDFSKDDTFQNGLRYEQGELKFKISFSPVSPCAPCWNKRATKCWRSAASRRRSPSCSGRIAGAWAFLAINRVLIRLSKTLFAYQVFIRARPLPDACHLLKETIAGGAALRAELLGRVA